VMMGVGSHPVRKHNSDQIKKNVQASDLCVGLSSELESEVHDRSNISLRTGQLEW